VHGGGVTTCYLPDELTPPDSVMEKVRKNNDFYNSVPPQPQTLPIRKGRTLPPSELEPDYFGYYKELTGKDFPGYGKNLELFPRIYKWWTGLGRWDD